MVVAHKGEADRYQDVSSGRLRAVLLGLPSPDISTSRDEIQELRSKYTLRNEQDIRLFLGKHSHLMSILSEAPRWIKSIFNSTDLALEMFRDPDDDTERLVLVIRTGLTPQVARNSLDLLDDKWWLDTSDKQDPDGNLSVNVEFK